MTRPAMKKRGLIYIVFIYINNYFIYYTNYYLFYINLSVMISMMIRPAD